jgi:hypothetical protein
MKDINLFSALKENGIFEDGGGKIEIKHVCI